jgi:transposase
MNEEGYALFSSRVPKDTRLAFEATTMAYPFARSLKELGYEDVTVAHPTELAWITRSKKKNDKAESLKIAKPHLAGLLPESHLLSREEQIERDLLIQRAKLGAEIGRMKVRILSYLGKGKGSVSLFQRQRTISPLRESLPSPLSDLMMRDLVLKTMLDR